MLTIGDLARLGRVSVRMLRHYDAIGLLPPTAVDDATGYRYYEAAQLARLNRIVALKDLGFTLDQVAAVLDDKIDAAELRGMLRLRRAELQSRIAADTGRLAQVQVRLRTIEEEGAMPMEDIAGQADPGRPGGRVERSGSQFRAGVDLARHRPALRRAHDPPRPRRHRGGRSGHRLLRPAARRALWSCTPPCR